MISFNQNKNFRATYYKYFNTKKKHLINNANIWFNKSCLHNKLTSKYAQIKNKPYSLASYKTNAQYSKLRIKNEIRCSCKQCS